MADVWYCVNCHAMCTGVSRSGNLKACTPCLWRAYLHMHHDIHPLPARWVRDYMHVQERWRRLW